MSSGSEAKPPATEAACAYGTGLARLLEALARALRDAFCLSACTSLALSNVERVSAPLRRVLRRRLETVRRSRGALARRMRALGGPVRFPHEPSTARPRGRGVDRGARSGDDIRMVRTTARRLRLSLSAAIGTAHALPEPATIAVLDRLFRREAVMAAALHRIAPSSRPRTPAR